MTEQAVARPLVVVIEDEADVLATLARQLRRLLPQFTILATQEGAASLTEAIDQPVALAVVDYYLRGHDGLIEVAALKQRSPHMRTILITASPLAGVEHVARMVGIDILLAKPFLMDELAKAIQTLLPLQNSAGEP
jgi:CheY-like chemotaxis protein